MNTFSEIFLPSCSESDELIEEFIKNGFDIEFVYDGYYIQKKDGMTSDYFKKICYSIIKGTKHEQKRERHKYNFN